MRYLIALVVVIALGAFACSLVATAQDVQVCGQIGSDGRLCNMSRRVPGKDDVVLRAMPATRGPCRYDAATKSAVPCEDSDLTYAEKIATLAPPSHDEIDALFVLASSKATAEVKAKAQIVVDARADLVAAKAGW